MTTLSEGCIGVTRDGYGVNRVETTRPEGFQLERDTNENSHKNSHLFCQWIMYHGWEFSYKNMVETRELLYGEVANKKDAYEIKTLCFEVGGRYWSCSTY